MTYLGLVNHNVGIIDIVFHHPFVTFERQLGRFDGYRFDRGSLGFRFNFFWIKSQEQEIPSGTASALTTLLARSSGFLCVISDLSTLRSPAVTLDPRELRKEAPPGGFTGAGVGAGTAAGAGADLALIVRCGQ